MRLRLSLLATVVAALSLAPARADTASDELKKLQGTWVIESFERVGKKVGSLAGGTMVFTEKEHSIRPKGVAEARRPKAAHQLDPAKSPKHIDIRPKTGSNIGKTHLGIYEIEGDRCRLCFADPPADERPAEFKSKEGIVLIVLRRQK
jgi:uncharacterized protein (TIGR03067 family)